MFIVYALLFMCVINDNYSDNIVKRNFLRIKNSTLKRLIRNDIKRVRSYLTHIRDANNKFLTKYYDSVYSFNLISDDDKILIEYVISLTF
jgi:hypothetical protein